MLEILGFWNNQYRYTQRIGFSMRVADLKRNRESGKYFLAILKKENTN